MTTLTDQTSFPALAQPSETKPIWFKRTVWNRFSILQLVVLTLATIAPVAIIGAIGAALLGAISLEAMIELALAAGEDPGMITFGAMFLASPVQWLTGRSQVRVRKYLGIVFFGLAASNGAMFVIESGIGLTFSSPLLIAGSIGLLLAVPLFLTSSRRAQRRIGMTNWRRLHKLTYLIAVALLGHVLFIGDIGPGAIMIAVGSIARLPAVRRRLSSRSGNEILIQTA